MEEGDFIIFYSDGFYSIIFSEDFNIAKQFDNLQKYFDKKTNNIDGAEGTLVAVKLD